MMTTKAVVHVVDNAATEAYAEREPAVVAAVELGGTRTLLIVPMLKENELVGAFTLSRQEVRPFTDKQITLVTNIAAQAVIAIENARGIWHPNGNKMGGDSIIGTLVNFIGVYSRRLLSQDGI
jgi:hypothetical protein